MERLSEKVIKGQIHDGSISQNTFHEVYKQGRLQDFGGPGHLQEMRPLTIHVGAIV